MTATPSYACTDLVDVPGKLTSGSSAGGSIRRRLGWLAAAALVVVAGISTLGAGTGPVPTGPVTLSASDTGDLSELQIDANGYTLYLLEPDRHDPGPCSGCRDDCPVLTEPPNMAPLVTDGSRYALLPGAPCDHGTPTVAHAGRPLLLHSGTAH